MNIQSKLSMWLFALLFIHISAKSQIVWPEGQLLPTFPATAATQDLIYLNEANNATVEEKYLFSSLKGIVNSIQPRIFVYDGDAAAEGAYTWLNSLGLKYIDYKGTDRWKVLDKYLSEIEGLIVYDPNEINTVNLATLLAKSKKALIAAPSLLDKLQAPPYNLPIVEDLRGRFTSKIQVYRTIYDDYWPNLDKRLLIGLNPTVRASLREYAIALGLAVVWLNPNDPEAPEESVLLNKFLASMPDGANYMGWWPAEQAGVTRVSQYGVTTIASDFSTNLTVHSGMPRGIDPKPMLAKPKLENKIYVAFVLSDGDNLQYVEHLLRKLWNNADRGAVPMGWTMSPAMVDAMPGALNYYHKTATTNDNIISGPSGYGYTYPREWTDTDALARFVAQTENYNVQAGFRVITVWNTITGGVSQRDGKIFADNAPTLLGLTAQNTGGALAVYNVSLPVQPLTCNYCTDLQAITDNINNGSKGWNGTAPKFLIIQAQPWQGVTPTTFKNAAAALNSNYVVVRPDQIFQLIREYNKLSINPGGIEGDGTGLTGVYFNGTNFETQVNTTIDTGLDFNWGTDVPMEGVIPNSFSVRWSGQVQPRYTGKYTFYITSDNVSRVWVNDQLIIDKRTTSQSTFTGTISMTAGQKYNIKTEYVAGNKSSVCKLEWASPFQSREVIPQSQLYKDASISGINGVTTFAGLKVFPNPSTNGIINIEANNYDNEDIFLTIYDSYGNALLKKTFREARTQLDVSNFSKGIYLISFRSNSDSKIIKQIIK